MKSLGCLILLALMTSANAGTTGTLFLKAYVPARTEVKVDPARGTFTIRSNTGRYHLTTWVNETTNARGFRVVTIIPQ